MANPLETSSDESLKPEKLYRAFTVSVRDLDADLFEKPLIPGSGVDTEHSVMRDGNEIGVYMTTNKTMANRVYAHSSDILKCKKFDSGYGLLDFVELPRCGITVEVDTDGLNVRRPKITSQLMGVYNNGFLGDEWVADEVPASKYRVIRFTLSTHSNDSSQVIREIIDDGDLRQAVQEMKTLYAKKLATAQEFAEFLGTLDDKTRLNEFFLKRAWEKHLEDKATDKVES